VAGAVVAVEVALVFVVRVSPVVPVVVVVLLLSLPLAGRAFQVKGTTVALLAVPAVVVVVVLPLPVQMPPRALAVPVAQG